MKDSREIELDISIDEMSLDREWTDQPRMYFRYAVKLADARRELDQANANLDLTKAELDTAIRSDPEKFGLAKVTESALEAVILTQDGYETAKAAVLRMKHDMDVMAAAVGALDHRKKALEKLCELFLANYFSRPRAPEGGKDRMDEIEKATVRRRGGNRGE